MTTIAHEKFTKKQHKTDHPTWSLACGDYADLASFFNLVITLQIPHEKIVCVADIGCSSRFPSAVNTHGIYFDYGLTKYQTSPTVPTSRKTKTDPRAAIDRSIDPMTQIISTGATFVARTPAAERKHMNEIYERAILHNGLGKFGIYYEISKFPSKNDGERAWFKGAQAAAHGTSPKGLLRKRFASIH